MLEGQKEAVEKEKKWIKDEEAKMCAQHHDLLLITFPNSRNVLRTSLFQLHSTKLLFVTQKIFLIWK